MANDFELPQSEAEGENRGFDMRVPHRTNASPPGFGRFALCIAAAGALAFGVLATVAYGVWFNHDQQAYAEAIASARQALGMPVPASVVASGAAAGRPVNPVALLEPAVPPAARGAAATQTIATAPVVSTRAATEALGSAAPASAMTGLTSNAPAIITPPGSQTIASESSTRRGPPVSDGEQGSQQAVWSGQVAPAPAEAKPQTVVLADATPRTPAPPSPAPRPTRRISKSADSAAQQSAAARSGKEARTAQAERRASAPNAKQQDSLFARMGQVFRRVDYRQHDTGRQQQDLYSHP
jgi:hypothetical protein